MSAAFYKTNDPNVLAAIATYESGASVVRRIGKEFAAHYGGKLLARNDLHGYCVAGLCFQPAKDDPLWTKPDPKNVGMQRPRSSLKNPTKDQKVALAELRAGWKARFPTDKAEYAPVLAAMGTDWGNLFFSAFAIFQHEGFIYVSTGATLAPCMTEILSSEYHTARTAYEGAKASA